MAIGTIPAEIARKSTTQKLDFLMAVQSGAYTNANLSWTLGLPYWVQLPFGHVTAGAEVDTGYDLPAAGILRDILIEITTADAGETLDVGLLSTGGAGFDINGFAAAVPLDTLGWIRPEGACAGSGASYIWTTNYRGALLAHYTAGTNADDRGIYLEAPHMTDSVANKSVSYTVSSSDTAHGNIWLRIENLA
jgi:hypothetical protein